MIRARRIPAPLALTASLAFVLSACGGGAETGGSSGGTETGGSSGGTETGGSGEAGGDPVAVATTTQLGSVLREIARCAGTGSATVMGRGDDPHDVAASSQQVAQMVRSGLVFANGLGLEGGMGTALENAQQDGATLVEVAPQLDPLPFGVVAGEHAGESTDEHLAHAGEGHDHAHGSQDPHVWLDVSRMAKAATVMGDALAEHTGNSTFQECGSTVRSELEDTDRRVREILDAVPQDRRVLVTDHDAYGYFADAYGFTVSGVLVPGGSTDSEPSSQELAALTASVREAGASAVVTSVAAPHGLVTAVATDAGGLPVVELYESGVGPADTPEADYGPAMVSNARTLADALSE